MFTPHTSACSVAVVQCVPIFTNTVFNGVAMIVYQHRNLLNGCILLHAIVWVIIVRACIIRIYIVHL